MRNFFRYNALSGFFGNPSGSGGSTGGGGSSAEEWFNDGNTHIWITLPEGRTSPMLSVCPNGTVTVDWGDGTEPDVLKGTNDTSMKYTPNHEYAKSGDYVITLTTDDTFGVKGNTNTTGILRYSSSNNMLNHTYASCIRKIELGDSVTRLTSYAFSCCYSLESVKLPDSLIEIGGYVFSNCYALKSINIPNSVTSIVNEAFSCCYSLESVKLPDSLTEIGSRAFSRCYSLESVNIPNSVTDIKTYAFEYCYRIIYYDFTNHTTVPTMPATTAFIYNPEDFEIRVPAALYDEWIVATNWTTYASNIVAV